MEAIFETREEWLQFAVSEVIEPRLSAAGYEVPSNIRISCGFPYGSRGGAKVLGQCFAPSVSNDHSHEVFVAPTLDDPAQVIGILAHEVCHAVVGVDKGHGKVFKQACDAVGLEGKPSENVPGVELVYAIEASLDDLGSYPHAKINLSERKKQGTRLLKLECGGCGFIARVTKKWADRLKPDAVCPCCEESFLAVAD